MIGRYAQEDIAALWSEEGRLGTMLDVELAVTQAWCEMGRVPKEALDDIRARARFTVERVEEIERTTQHDVVAFVSAVAESVGENGRWLHLGLTSSDVLDTASAIMLRRSMGIILSELGELEGATMGSARRYKDLPCVGRTHGIHAEPTSLGLKILNWRAQLGRDRVRLEAARESVSCGKISGAVGTYALCPPELEARVCELLGLTPARVSNQILQRDRHAEVMNALALLGCALERMATEIRHLQRTEVGEAFEPFGRGQKGSSAMPHKRNPIKCERVCGMARLLRGWAVTAMEDVALWHERDISHSSVERVIWPDAFHVAAAMLRDMVKILKGLEVDEARVRRNLGMTGGLVYSQRVLTFLLDEAEGLSREEAYAVVQDAAMRTARGDGTFADLLLADPRIRAVTEPERIRSLFDDAWYLRHVDEIFARFDG
ncbi:MAG: adenylosuccinate lyase [Synergistaceae bacterium]|nr:adenylosuccinate lyase [Synergistaceae bacterium]